MSEKILGKDYVILKGRGERDIYNGATVKGDKFMHLGFILEKKTACGEFYESFLATYSDVEIDCPKCIAEIKKR